ncbi:hypothetical protein EMCRGX_G031894 [Ephydatia muelleri]
MTPGAIRLDAWLSTALVGVDHCTIGPGGCVTEATECDRCQYVCYAAVVISRTDTVSVTLRSEISLFHSFTSSSGSNNLTPAGLALAKLLEEHLESDNHWRQKSKWIIELANEAYQISFCGIEIKSKLNKIGNIKDGCL